MNSEKTRFVGQRTPLKDAEDKVTGRAVFGVDFSLPGMLYAKVLRSPHAHARILGIDTSRAEKIPGVHAVVTGKDAPDTRYGIKLLDEYFLARDEVFYIGDEVAAVIAVDEKTAEEALRHIQVEYEPLPAVFDALEAVKPGAVLARGDTSSNICHHVEIQRGDIEAGFQQAAVVCEATYYLPHQYQSYLEPHAATAQWKNGRLTVWAPHQAPLQLEKVVCDAFQLPKGAFQYIQTYVGGGFGGKTHMRVVPLVALLAKIAGAPVHLALSREEDFVASMPCVPMYITVKMGADAEGYVTAKDVRIVADNGAYTASAAGVLEVAAIRVDALYRFKNVRVSGDLVYTNKVGTSAFRGYGNTQMHFAIESMMDTLAHQLKMDPVEFRLRNATRNGDITVHGWKMGSCGLSEAIQTAAAEIGWRDKFGRMRDKARGVGIACGIHVSGATTVVPFGAVAVVRLHGDGTIHVATSEGDIGQGARTTFALIAAEELGVPYDRVVVDQLDTDVTNFGVGAIGSRVTVLGGNAVRKGAAAMRKKLIEVAAQKWGCTPDDVHIEDGLLINYRTEETLNLSQIAEYYYDETGGGRMMCEALYKPEGVVPPDATRYGNVSLGYSFAAHAAEVEVDLETGQVNVLNYVAVHDSGRIINPLTTEGQIEGAIGKGIGYALKEEYVFHDGRILNPDFTNYRVPTSLDMPPMKIILLDVIDPNGPFGAKSIGEVAMVPAAPAIANAVYDAIGIRFTELPMTPERVLLALKDRQQVGTKPS